MKQIVQGDVYFIKVDRVPEKAKKTENRVIAVGEATGHSHVITGDVEVFEENGIMYIVVPDKPEVKIVHNTHKPGIFDQGIWMSGHVREFNPFLDMTLYIKD